MERALALAKQHGPSAAGLNNCGHVGRLGEWVELAATQNAAALAFCNGGGATGIVTPFGGAERLLATNPIAAALPVGDQPPILPGYRMGNGVLFVVMDSAAFRPVEEYAATTPRAPIPSPSLSRWCASRAKPRAHKRNQSYGPVLASSRTGPPSCVSRLTPALRYVPCSFRASPKTAVVASKFFMRRASIRLP